MKHAERLWYLDCARAASLPRLAVEVYIALFRYAAMPNGAEPSIAALAEDTRASERAVQKSLRRLEAASWVTTTRRTRERSHYELNVRANAVHPSTPNRVHPQSANGKGERKGERRSRTTFTRSLSYGERGASKICGASVPPSGPGAIAGPSADKPEDEGADLIALLRDDELRRTPLPSLACPACAATFPDPGRRLHPCPGCARTLVLRDRSGNAHPPVLARGGNPSGGAER